MNVDPKFTKEIQDWLYKENKTDDMAMTGAALLERINPRNLVYRRWMSIAVTRPASIMGKIEYELKKHLQYRLDGLTLEEVRRLDQKVVPEASKIITEGAPAETAAARTAAPSAGENGTSTEAEASEDGTQTVKLLGKRADHDTLPDSIKDLWDDNGKLYKDIKALFEELKSMEDLPSCDRYDKLQLLASLDNRYLKQMERYDNYETGKEDAEEAQKNIGSARSYLSKNLDKLSDMKSASEAETATDADKDAYKTLLDKMQQRLDIIISAKAPITDELKARYEQLGLKTNHNEDTDDTDSTETAE